MMKPAAKLTLALPALALLAACGAGGGGLGGGEDYVPVTAVPGVTTETLERNLNAQNRQAANTVGASNGMNLRPGEMVNAQITFARSRLNDDGTTADASVTIFSDGNGDGIVDTSIGTPDNTYRQDLNTGNDASRPDQFTSQNVTIGGENAVMARENNDFFNTVVYVPASEASRMYGGAYIRAEGGGGYSGVFGRETTTQEMSAQDGTVTYNGNASTTLQRSGLLGESGLFEGDASASVNFDNRTFDTTATMSRANVFTTGADTIGVNASGTINNDGSFTGTTNLTGAGTVMTGDMRGQFYGPNADTMGAVFTANGSDPANNINSENTNASGVLLMNR